MVIINAIMGLKGGKAEAQLGSCAEKQQTIVRNCI